ncbi:hypothetical protein N7489_003963, partial [Penicillium chrysogenum]|uniref:uncharacterized protein n=1 Tax=Penicillium chrysogenum TaxID=5076 RepID=UPI0024DF265C
EDPIKPVPNGSKSALDSGTRNPFTIRSRASSRDITPSNNSVTLGDYDISSEDGIFVLTDQVGAITVTNEDWFLV